MEAPSYLDPRDLENQLLNFKNLPLELQEGILLQLTYPDLARLRETSRLFRGIIDNDMFWKRKIQRDFGATRETPKMDMVTRKPVKSWKEVYLSYGKKLGEDLVSAVAAGEEKSQVVQELLDLGVDPNFATKYWKDTALNRASEYGHTAIVEMLLNAGANLNLVDRNGETPLMRASREGHTDIVKMLLNAGANPDLEDRNGETALMRASVRDRAAIVEMLLNARADPNLANKSGRTALIQASDFGHTAIVEMLLNARADPDRGDWKGNTALILASDYGHTAIVEMLLNAGANLNLQNEYGYTALILASNKGDADIVEMLLNAGANPDLEDRN